jgi:hypothetical protein
MYELYYCISLGDLTPKDVKFTQKELFSTDIIASALAYCIIVSAVTQTPPSVPRKKQLLRNNRHFNIPRCKTEPLALKNSFIIAIVRQEFELKFSYYYRYYYILYIENNTWVRGNTRFISSVEHDISRVSAANE